MKKTTENSEKNLNRKKAARRLLLPAILLALALLAGGCACHPAPAPESSASEPAAPESSVPESSSAPEASQSSAPEPEASESSAAEPESSQTEPVAPESSPAEPIAPEEADAALTLSEEQIYTGDLILVNAEHGYRFEENEADIDLVRILDAQSIPYAVGKSEFQLASRVMPHLDRMIEECDAAMGTSYTGISSAYRSLDYQQNVWQEIEDLYGRDYAESHVAAPGFSEHHTGLAADFGIFYPTGLEGMFSESENAQWMREHCGDYGFIRRYAENKTEITGIKNEAWHFRYVGLPHSAYMTEQDLCLEEYLELLRTRTSAEDPLVIAAGEKEYEVWYTDDPEVVLPKEDAARLSVSGDNIGGWILTLAP